jgi:hypothetical protein
LTPMLLNELQKQYALNTRQAEQIQHLSAQNEQQAVYNRRLSAQVAQLKGMFEQAMAVQRRPRSLAAAFDQ